VSSNLPEIPDDVFETVKRVEKQLSLPEGFYDDLYEDDDWSFVIKLHSLMEAAVSGLLMEVLGHTQLYEVISRLELSNRTTGKMAFVKSLDLVDDNFRRFIHTLSEIRNDFVHDVSNVGVDLQKYLSQPGQLEAATKAFCFGVDKVEYDERELSNKEYMKENPKHVIWIGGVLCLSVIYIRRLQAVHKRELKKIRDHKLGKIEGIEEVFRKLGIPVPEWKDKPKVKDRGHG
jgi:hypothetical protein